MNVDEILQAAIDQATPAERAAYLDGACGMDAGLRALVEGLLQAHDAAGGFLQEALFAITPGADCTPLSEGPGTVVGPYKLLQAIGEGGMGTVFMAGQEKPVRRTVAVKVIRPGLESTRVVARFEAERQALALMDHPNIAKVLDAGATDTGRPYFVMELVKGVPITTYCDERLLTLRERLELFLPVCQAVQHAHQKGIIHRDLKPSNVMVCLYDGRPVPKVIDFGVAKASGPKLTERTLFTEYGQVVGTLEYMSPEQAELDQLDVDTRSDIYSLGVLLYELLTGSTPLERKRRQETSLLDVLRIIREEEPPRPSTRLSTARELATIAANRGLDPGKLGGLVRGELDWIVLKALEKDRNRRYESASALARDVEHYLADEPVLACPPSRWYRLQKSVRRNKGALLTAACVFVALLGGTAISAWQAVRARQAETLAEQRLEAEGQARRQALANLKKARAGIDQMLTRVADERLLFVPQMEEVRRDLLRDALTFYRELLDENGDDLELRQETALAQGRLGRVLWLLGQPAAANQTLRQAVAALEAPPPSMPLTRESRTTLIDFYTHLASTCSALRQPAEAEAAVRRAVAQAESLVTEFPDSTDLREQLLSCYLQLASLVRVRTPGRGDAEPLLIRAIDMATPTVKGRRLLAYGQINFGVWLEGAGRSAEADKAYRTALDVAERLNAESPGNRLDWQLLAAALVGMGGWSAEHGSPGKAEACHQRALALYEKLTLDFPHVPQHRTGQANCLNGLGTLFLKAHRFPEAEATFRRVVAVYEKLSADFPNELAYLQQLPANQDGLYVALAGAGRVGEAEAAFDKAAAYREKLAIRSGTDPVRLRRELAEARLQLGTAIQRVGRLQEAAAEFRKAGVVLGGLATEFPSDPRFPYLQARACNFLGIALRGLPGETDAAVKNHERAATICQKLKTDFPDLPNCRAELARSHYARGHALQQSGRWAQAAQAFTQALDAYRPDHDSNYGGLPASVRNSLAWLRANCPDAQCRDSKAALDLASRAVEAEPKNAGYWNTLGAAYYRTSNWQKAVAAFENSMGLNLGGNSFDWFFLALTHHHLGNKDQARTWYDRANDWMAKHQPANNELRRIRAEAALVLGLPQSTR